MSKALGKGSLEGSWEHTSYKLESHMCFREGAVGMHVGCEQGLPVLTWERRPVGHEDQLVSNGFGSGVVVHVLSENRKHRATERGSETLLATPARPTQPSWPQGCTSASDHMGVHFWDPHWEMARP